MKTTRVFCLQYPRAKSSMDLLNSMTAEEREAALCLVTVKKNVALA